MFTLPDFEAGDKVEILGLEPYRNPDFPFDLFRGRHGTVTEVDSHNLAIWVRLEAAKPLPFEPWELTKSKSKQSKSKGVIGRIAAALGGLLS
ncbi:MAG: hypothetical protein ACE5H6_01060 [Dehalococcoidia bacterium]